MALDRLTKVDGRGISTTSDYRVGIITATKFVGPIEGTITSADATFTGNVSIAGTLTYEDVTNVDSVGVITARNGIKVSTGTATTALVVDGDARVTGILTVGTSSLKLDGPNNLVNVGTALTLGHSQGVQFHTQNLHSAGFEVNQINASGIITATTFKGDGDFVELDVDGHTNLDNVNIAGVTTFSGDITATGDINANDHINLASGKKLSMAGDVFKIYHSTNAAIINESGDLLINQNVSNKDIKISTGSGPTERVRILSGGNVLIGTTTDSTQKLTLYGTNSAVICQGANTGTGASQGFITGNNGNVNSFVWNYENGFMHFATNNTERLRIHADGEVEIKAAANGQTVLSCTAAYASSSTVDIQTWARSDGAVKAAMKYNHGTNSMNFGTTTNHPLIFQSNNSEKIRIDTSGRVFINRTAQHASSSERLSVNGMTSIQLNSAVTAGLYIFNEETTTSGNPVQPFIYFHDGSGLRSGLGVQRSTGKTIVSGQFGLSLRTGSSGVSGSERLHITSSGDVSISSDGTVHGVSKLTLLPADRTTAFAASDGDTWHDVVLKQTGSAARNAVGIAFETSTSGYHKNAGTGIAAVKNGTNSDYGSDLVFITRPQSAVAAERVRITSDGKFGVGDFTSGTAVSQALHVKGSEPKIYLEHTGGYDMTLTTSDGAGNNGITVNGGALSLAYNNKNIWMCRTGGYVSIGHMSPITRLDIKQNNGVAYNNRAQTAAYGVARFFNESGHQSGGTYTGFQFNLTGDSQNRICSIGMISEASNTRNSSLVFATDDNGNRNEKVRITSTGRLVLYNSDGIQLSPQASNLYATNGTLSYYATNNAVYLNGAGDNGLLRLNATGVYNDRTSINLFGKDVGSAPDTITFRTVSEERLRIKNTGETLQKTLSGNYYPVTSARDGSTSARAAQSAWEIKKTLGPAAKTGYYYLINPYDGTTSQWWCDMDTDGGGWILIAHHGDGQMADQGTTGAHWWHRNDKGGFDTVGSGYKRGGGYWRKTNGGWGENTCGELMWDVRIHNVFGTNPSYGAYGITAASNHKVAFRWGTDQPLPTGNSDYTNIPNAGNRRFNEWCREVENAPGFNPGNYHQNVRSNIISGGNYFTEHMGITWCFRQTSGAADAGDQGPYWFIGQHANGLHQHYEENISGDVYGDGAVQLVSNQDSSWNSNPGGTNQGYLRLSKISDTGTVNIWLR